MPIPEDASAVLVRQYVADRSVEQLAEFRIVSLDPVGLPGRPSDEQVAEGLGAMGWTLYPVPFYFRVLNAPRFFANLTYIIDQIPDDTLFDTRALESILRKHKIL